MVPSTTDDDPYLPHARTAQELGRLDSCPWLCVVERTPQFEIEFLVSFVLTRSDVLKTAATMNFLSLFYNQDGLWGNLISQGEINAKATNCATLKLQDRMLL